MAELTSNLPHGKAFPIGDKALWEACMMEALRNGPPHADVMQMYADVRGITRPEAKNEMFTILYGTN